ncbi:hypothetical protein [Chryseobacterium sp. PET-29]|uniref:hypothetical protein n=1 Tax=Chryseobacterium sp. PET-29 TaxID=2983267 RepID=UPI0021E5D3F2|nr:hypothetical protein [Chryseobacterium sp. PET-29]
MENNFNIEVDKSSKKTIIIFIIAFGCILLLTIMYLIINSNRLVKEKILAIERNARVVDIYNNKKEHNFLYVKYSNGNQKLLEYPYKLGDSVSKKKGDSIEYIFRKDSIIKNNLLEDSRKNGFLK